MEGDSTPMLTNLDDRVGGHGERNRKGDRDGKKKIVIKKL